MIKIEKGPTAENSEEPRLSLTPGRTECDEPRPIRPIRPNEEWRRASTSLNQPTGASNSDYRLHDAHAE